MGAVFLLAGVTNAVDVLEIWRFYPGFSGLFSNIAMVIGGGGALLTGLRMNRTRKLERLLDNVVGERDNIPLPELFAAAGVDAARGRPAVKAPSSTDTSARMPILTTAPTRWWCGVRHHSRKSPHRLRHLKLSPPQRTSTPPCCASCER